MRAKPELADKPVRSGGCANQLESSARTIGAHGFTDLYEKLERADRNNEISIQ
ncbi:MAG: hypothetical protein AAB306_00345 [Pseudomonadota bacterium]